MPTRIRLRRGGKRNAAFYRIVVADARAPRDGRYVDLVGRYDPLRDPPEISVDTEKALDWLRKGAQPTETVRSLLRRVGVMKAFEDERDEKRRSRAPEAGPEETAEPTSEELPTADKDGAESQQ